MNKKAVLAIHGGAGTISGLNEQEQGKYKDALREILSTSYSILARGGSSLDAVMEAVRLLEECPLFNAGIGSVFNSDGRHELDASIMEGSSLRAGAVAAVSTIRNPILAARAVMDKTSHVLLSSAGAEQFARSCGLEMVEEGFFSTPLRVAQLQKAKEERKVFLDHDGGNEVQGAKDGGDAGKFGTVGAVALDQYGNLSSATSTGGMTNKMPGRIGDTPLIGAGCYANKVAAVSTTGIGEMFMRLVAAYDLCALMEYGGLSLDEAASNVLFKLASINGDGGLIAIDHLGNVVMPFISLGMYRGMMDQDGSSHVAIYPN